jgi:3-oxoacyl-[acyl-carrier-protein] synthase-1
MEEEVFGLRSIMNVYIESDNIISPLGFTTEQNFSALLECRSGIKFHKDKKYSQNDFYGAIIDDISLDDHFSEMADPIVYTRFEKLCISSITGALKQSSIDVSSDRTVIILSTTKGNIDYLSESSEDMNPKVYLWNTAKFLKEYFKSRNDVLVVSTACISGISALLMGQRLIQSGIYDNAIVCGCDIFSSFVMSGFQSFQAISYSPCKPFDADRSGITLGEGCGTLIITNNQPVNRKKNIKISGGAISNDANHISGPSRTGDGLTKAIDKALGEAVVSPNVIDFISAHGTATPYNDEMEAIAFATSGLLKSSVNSLKGYFGHTLGAAGTIESIVTLESMRQNMVIKSIGYETSGVSQELNIAKSNIQTKLTHCLKTASGFGGGNAAIVFSKVENE